MAKKDDGIVSNLNKMEFIGHKPLGRFKDKVYNVQTYYVVNVFIFFRLLSRHAILNKH